MIPDKIQDLFKFIDFLDDNKETFYKYNTNFDNAIKLRSQKLKLKPNDKFSDKIKAEELKTKKNEEYNKVLKNVTKPIQCKITDLGFDKENHFWNFKNGWAIKNTATIEDLPIIKGQLSKYFKFRKSGKTYFCDMLFTDLDEFFMDLSEYFDQGYPDELKGEFSKDLTELVEMNKKGKQSKITMSNLFRVNNQSGKVEPQQDPEEEKEKPLEFKDLFESEAGFQKVVKVLSEANYIDTDTLVWKDNGNGYKSLASALIKFIHVKGYFEIKPTNEEILSVLKNTFKIDTTIDTVKRANANNVEHLKLQL